ncbi:hypothetical protein EROP_12190 [Erysipelotrichaceae bacterium OPF54]|nr:hypothetical protein EROP_12190 [Erysipelotrichaceae bacterium OPF54]
MFVSTYGKHEGAKLLGTLDYGTGEIHLIERHKNDVQVFLGFLKQILKLYSVGKIILVLDNFILCN